MSNAKPARYKTDFNDVDDDGVVTTLPGWGGSVLVPNIGDAVELFDGDENTCLGTVERVDMSSGLIFVRPVWDTWRDAPSTTLPNLEDALLQAATREQGGQRSGVAPIKA